MLINSAVFGLPLDFERNDIEDEARHLRLHVEVPMQLMHAALPGMLERRSGTILNIASASAVMPRSSTPGWACRAARRGSRTGCGWRRREWSRSRCAMPDAGRPSPSRVGATPRSGPPPVSPPRASWHGSPRGGDERGSPRGVPVGRRSPDAALRGDVGTRQSGRTARRSRSGCPWSFQGHRATAHCAPPLTRA
ncbi:hypothetical protein [Brachybacterium sp. GU-2]|uniref:hypothetical protein n=1 Tax=Brachybacterium sp. GU-2 TaxID=3069708 RepID=UPI00399B3B5A